MRKIQIPGGELPEKIDDVGLRDEILAATGLPEADVSIVRVHDAESGIEPGIYVELKGTGNNTDIRRVVRNHAPEKSTAEKVTEARVSQFDEKLNESSVIKSILDRLGVLEAK